MDKDDRRFDGISKGYPDGMGVSFSDHLLASFEFRLLLFTLNGGFYSRAITEIRYVAGVHGLLKVSGGSIGTLFPLELGDVSYCTGV